MPIEAGDLLNKYTNCPGTPLQIEAVTDSTLRIHARTQKSFAVETAPFFNRYSAACRSASGDSAETSVLVLATDSLRITIDDALHLQISSSDGTVLCSDYTGPLQEAELSQRKKLSRCARKDSCSCRGDACRFQITKKLFGEKLSTVSETKPVFSIRLAMTTPCGIQTTLIHMLRIQPSRHCTSPFLSSLHCEMTVSTVSSLIIHFKTNFDMGYSSTDYYSFGAADGELDYYFFYGDTIADIISQYTALTGRCPLPQLLDPWLPSVPLGLLLTAGGS